IAWSATTNTGPTTAGAVVKAVSMFNVVDAAGNLWDWLDAQYDLGVENRTVWNDDIINVGKDAAIPRGKIYSYVYDDAGTDRSSWRSFIGGGRFDIGASCGARCLGSYARPWDAIGGVGLRGVCDAL